MRQRAPLALLSGVSLGVAAATCLLPQGARAAEPSEKEQCIGAAERGQQLRDDGKLLLAHEAFAQCARDVCPSLVKKDCGAWLHELDEKSPTVLLKATDDAGTELTNVIVLMDDTSIAATLDGRPVAVDPGEHLFHFETSGLPPVEQHLVIRPGDRNRLIQVQIAGGPKTAPAVVPPQVSQEPSPTAETPAPSPASLRSPPLAAWVLGGVALAAFGSEAYFGLTALNDRSTDLAPGGCSPHCGSLEKSSIQTRFVVADVSLGVGLVSAGLATYFFLAPREASRSVALDFVGRPGGGVTTIRGRF